MPPLFFIGWDVGGWNCERNAKSRDALAILNAELSLVGKPWRGNLSDAINAAADSADFVNRLFELCKAVPPRRRRITLAIDIPLGFSDDFIRLVTRKNHAGEIGRSETNPYLFRYTERYLFERGLKPLSSIKDLQKRFGPLGHADLDDALPCALLAYLFTVRTETLEAPPKKTPVSEGWIWIPKDGLPKKIEIIDRGNL
jgi:hypothetical protein